MTTAEALAVVREALDTYVEDVVPDEGFCDPWYAALALIEQRLGEVEAERDFWEKADKLDVLERDRWSRRAEKAEAERDEARQYLRRAEKQTTAAEQRVAELESALRFYDAARIARRALGGGS